MPSDEAILGMVFDTLEGAELFYNAYAKQIGFSIRKRDSRQSRSGQMLMQKWVCSKEGYRQKKWINYAARIRKPRRLTRGGCEAMIRVNLDRDTEKWVVKSLVSAHNHKLVPSKYVHLLRSHREIKEGDEALIESLSTVGVSTRHITEICKEQHGGYQNMGFIPKDVENKVQAIRMNKIKGGDANTTIGYFEGRVQADSSFSFDYTLKEGNKLGNLFWADSTSRSDYALFGDVLAFDACYRRQKYNNPLVMLIGVNHHHQTVMFGCAFLKDEKSESYIWLLDTFVKCMGGKKPLSVITDGDKAMRQAISQVLPKAAHRLCSWHIDRNAGELRLGLMFLQGLNKFMKSRISVEEFEESWQHLVTETKLDQHPWVKGLYADRHMWCEAYLKGKFFGGMATTSRCEGMNSTINKYVDKKLTLFEFVKRYERMVDKLRFNESKDDFRAFNSKSVCSHVLRGYEKQAEELYTPTMFELFKEELNGETSYLLSEPMRKEGEFEIFKLHQWSKSSRVRIVEYDTKEDKVICSCSLFESMGIPCRHILNVIKLRGMHAIPQSCFKLRWTKKAKGLGSTDAGPSLLDNKLVETMRRGALVAKSYKIFQMASQSGVCFDKASTELTRLSSGIEKLMNESMPPPVKRKYGDVRDPDIVKTKGTACVAPNSKKPRKCSKCRQPDHNKTRCPRGMYKFFLIFDCLGECIILSFLVLFSWQSNPVQH
ncbi:unnamed protein product [Linum tenue]|uniref:SWIM-type domain-containing protein n=2 Tax=Linum tenue TaxID=586396 RepID=A0AAV0QG15_9ROSI|nr:unnamed protein product [Linum tenue]